MISTANLTFDFTRPSVNIALVNSTDGTDISTATVGDIISVVIDVPSENVLPRRCYAVGIDSAEIQNLTDTNGCSVWPQFSEFRQIQSNGTTSFIADLEAFRFASSMSITIECMVEFCVSTCSLNCVNAISTAQLANNQLPGPSLAVSTQLSNAIGVFNTGQPQTGFEISIDTLLPNNEIPVPPPPTTTPAPVGFPPSLQAIRPNIPTLNTPILTRGEPITSIANLKHLFPTLAGQKQARVPDRGVNNHRIREAPRPSAQTFSVDKLMKTSEREEFFRRTQRAKRTSHYLEDNVSIQPRLYRAEGPKPLIYQNPIITNQRSKQTVRSRLVLKDRRKFR